MHTRENELSNLLAKLEQELVAVTEEKSEAKDFSHANLTFAKFLNTYHSFKNSNTEDKGERSEVDFFARFKSLLESNNIEFLCITMACRDDEVDQAALGKKVKFHKKGLSHIVHDSSQLLSTGQYHFLTPAITRLTLTCHWSPRDGVGAYKETTQVCKALTEDASDVVKYPRLHRFTTLGCSTALPPTNTLAEPEVKAESAATQALVQWYEKAAISKTEKRELEKIYPGLKGITLFQPQFPLPQTNLSPAQKKSRMDRLIKRTFIEEDRFDPIFSRLAEKAVVTINQNRPADKRVAVKGYTVDVNPQSPASGAEFMIKAEEVRKVKAKSVLYIS